MDWKKIWDSPGQERFKEIISSAINNTQGIFLVFDITNEQSFKDLQNWVSKVNTLKDINSFPFILIANKIDLEEERKISSEQCQEFSENNKPPWFETSAKTGKGVQEAFDCLINKVLSINDKNGGSNNFVIQ